MSQKLLADSSERQMSTENSNATLERSSAQNIFPPSSFLACDGVLGPGECHAAPEGAAGTEDQDDPGKHPTAAGGAETHPGAAAESPGTGDTGRRAHHLSGAQPLVKCNTHKITT